MTNLTELEKLDRDCLIDEIRTLTRDRDYWKYEFEKLDISRAVCCADMEEQRDEYKKALEYYASPENWCEVEDQGCDLVSAIDDRDVELIDNEWIGGKRARAALEKFEWKK